MRYEGIPILEENEINFLVDIIFNINNAVQDQQKVPNDELISITKQLIEKYKVNFAEFVYQLRNDDNAHIWAFNGFEDVFEAEMLDDLESVLFETYRELLKK